jgi:hypothetical protein
MAINFSDKIKKLGGIERIAETDENDIQDNIEYTKNIMMVLPEDEIINFTKEYGFSMFKNEVLIKSNEKNYFLKNGKIELGIIYGFGKSNDSVKEIIETYYIEEQLNKKFYPLFEGYPGDIIFYSLEKETFGKIYYWHHESEPGKDILLIKNTFEEFINGLYSKKIKEEKLKILSDEELKNVNERRKNFGLPLIDKYGNQLKE